ncbi:MAG: DegQ family serine endoprotease [bacterium]
MNKVYFSFPQVRTFVMLGALLTPLLIVPPSLADETAGHVAEGLPETNIANGFADLIEAVKPAVVNISVTGTVSSSRGAPGFRGQSPELEEFFKRFFGDEFKMPEGEQGLPFERKTTAVGSGFVIDPEGLVVTNNHVIEGADEIEVVFDDGTRIPAELKGIDAKTDLALLEIKGDSPFPFVKFGQSETARVGDWVVAIGNPFGLGGTTTKGIISARGRDIRSGPLDDFIQIDAAINRGNSGGPLFNMRGEVIGINSAIYSPNGGSVGIGFAIPSAMANNVINQLRDTGTVQRGYLGVQIQSVSEEIADSLGLDKARGALVTQVIENSPAEKAGVEAGDIILQFDGKGIPRMRELPKIVALTETNKEVDVVVWRNEKEQTIRVSVGGNADITTASVESDTSETGKLGLSVAALDEDARKKYGIPEEATGVVITAIKTDSPASERGLSRGELIKKIGSTEVEEPEQVNKAIAEAIDNDKKSVLLLVERDSRVRYVVIPLE